MKKTLLALLCVTSLLYGQKEKEPLSEKETAILLFRMGCLETPNIEDRDREVKSKLPPCNGNLNDILRRFRIDKISVTRTPHDDLLRYSLVEGGYIIAYNNKFWIKIKDNFYEFQTLTPPLHGFDKILQLKTRKNFKTKDKNKCSNIDKCESCNNWPQTRGSTKSTIYILPVFTESSLELLEENQETDVDVFLAASKTHMDEYLGASGLHDLNMEFTQCFISTNNNLDDVTLEHTRFRFKKDLKIQDIKKERGAHLAVLFYNADSGGRATICADQVEAFAVVGIFEDSHENYIFTAHELGHLLGATHDACGNQTIMCEITSETKFSSENIKKIRNAVPHILGRR